MFTLIHVKLLFLAHVMVKIKELLQYIQLKSAKCLKNMFYWKIDSVTSLEIDYHNSSLSGETGSTYFPNWQSSTTYCKIIYIPVLKKSFWCCPLPYMYVMCIVVIEFLYIFLLSLHFCRKNIVNIVILCIVK